VGGLWQRLIKFNIGVQGFFHLRDASKGVLLSMQGSPNTWAGAVWNAGNPKP